MRLFRLESSRPQHSRESHTQVPDFPQGPSCSGEQAPHFPGWVGVLPQVHSGLWSVERVVDFLPLRCCTPGVLDSILVLEGCPCIQILYRSVDERP